MKLFGRVFAGTLAIVASFNVTEALLENGVNVTAIPDLAGLVVQSISPRLLDSCQVEPYCTFSPAATLEVSTLVLIARLAQCQLAVKNGGHAAFPGASSIEGGITGLACDNIVSYELVTASGVSINVSEKSLPDLYWALRGGGNNFGIYDGTRIPPLIDAFSNAITAAEKDTKLAHFFAISYYSGMKIASTGFEYFIPIDAANPPEILKEYLAIPSLQTNPGLSKSMPAGFRATMWSQSFKLNAELMKRMSNHFFEIAPTMPAVSPNVSFQAFSKPALKAMQKKGGHTLGLYPEDGPFFHALFYLSWRDAKDDKAIMEAAQDYINTSIAMSEELGAYNDYMYMPYSNPYQPVISGYGAEIVAKLKAISSKYDPSGVFQKLQPGYVKLDGSASYGMVV
ncbi:hypothetical protein EK21DRAFT_100359 [Setomelanomma holmii]|uniref:FAD-binding PCMH-type domain-containing protein n=1 Tax=Setomelanomma holmii TaxID=210430 RepID=A0A9P4LP37_9PLEO|nr:hypothetical protein EK21DRAFT_100359 [Setomelanomma holmii]